MSRPYQKPSGPVLPSNLDYYLRHAAARAEIIDRELAELKSYIAYAQRALISKGGIKQADPTVRDE